MRIDQACEVICPEHKLPLHLDKIQEKYICPSDLKCSYEITKGVPRFVSADNYASSFGLQWNTFRKTQLDSYTGVPISKDRLTRLSGGNLGIFNCKKVLEAGCGAGRFTEILLASKAKVVATDLSSAVEANYEQFKNNDNYSVCQANICNLPFKLGQFDVVVCVGVIQHTPSPEDTISALCDQLCAGGFLIVDHYSKEYPETISRKLLRSFLIHTPRNISMGFCKVITTILWPLHKLFWKLSNQPTLKKVKIFYLIRKLFLRLSPIVDYYDAYPDLGEELLYQWALLDTHDTLTDFYKHLRSADEIVSHLSDCGMECIEFAYAGNGVEVRATKS